jgi:hypothetical protein
MSTYEARGTTSGVETVTTGPTLNRGTRPSGRRWPTRETKPSFMTTEFWIYLIAVAGVLVASYVVGSEDGHDDYFRADKAWLYIVGLTVGYVISRGLAKAGSADHGSDDRD